MQRAHALVAPLALLVLPQVDPALLAGLRARSIGPAGMSGRVADVQGLESNPDVVYVGAATGGLWKSVDSGLTFAPLFDREGVAAIGAIALDPRRPESVWIGTGEGNPRNSASVGDGVYRSLDGGRTWKHLGLARSERIHRILLHPSDPDVAWVAALGPTWGPGGERGVYKTEDGGASWTRVLFVDERTGCADLALAPDDPDHLLAAMWEHRRWPWFFRSGGPGSGLFSTRDGGASWTRLTHADGLPKGELGRIGVAFARSDARVVYALVEAEKSALLRSADGGARFVTVNDEVSIAPRPFYYADVRVDPRDQDRVYNLASTVTVSDDAGKSFHTLIPWSLVHPDHHAMWIDPNDPRHIVEGNDGGVAISRDRGATWRFVRNLPLAQYYHIAVDDEVPYNVYGGMQDNGSWRGPSRVYENGGIRNHHWREVAFGDGFATLPLPGDARQGYAMSQGGALVRWNLSTGERKSIRPDGPSGVELRFNWNAGIALDPHDPDGVYYGSQFLHRSGDRGDTWTALGGDLSTNDPAWQRQRESGGLTPDVTDAENHCSILTIAPSPLARGVVWVGSDDGRIHVTRDGGASFTSVERNLRGVPANTWVAHIEASKHDAAEAFAVLDDHRRSNGATYVLRTRDFGASWEPLATGDVRGYAHCIEQDPLARELLYLGTEFGLWISLDGGKRWLRFTHGLPTVAVSALVVHPREHDLVIGTHGRAAYVIDDVRPLRALTPEVLGSPLHLFEVAPARQHVIAQTGEARFPGSEEFRGENRPYGALLSLWVDADWLAHPDPEVARRAAREPAKELPTKVSIEISDDSGALARTLERDVVRGLNRITWDLSGKGFRRPRGDDDDDDEKEEEEDDKEPRGPEVLPGTYGVRVRFGEHEVSGSVEVQADARVGASLDARREKRVALLRAGALQELVADALERVAHTRADLALVRAKAKRQDEVGKKELEEALDALEKQLGELERSLWVPPSTKGIVADDRVVLGVIDRARGSLGSSLDAPTPAQRRLLADAERALSDALPEINRVLGDEVARLRERAVAAGVELLPALAPLALPEGQGER